MKKETEYDHRLADLAAAWIRQAKELDVYLKYEFTGVAAAPGREGVLEAVDALVTQAILLCGAAPERNDRWFNLMVDRQPEMVRLVCASSGICPVELAPLVKLGASADLRQDPDTYAVTVDWKAPDEWTEMAGGAPC